MDRRVFVSHLLRWGCVAGSSSCLAGCGTVFHSERVHQPHSRDIDWKIAALDGLALAFFFVPGVIAFVVDFSTGAIYLPVESPGNTQPILDGVPVTPAQQPATILNSPVSTDQKRDDRQRQLTSSHAKLERVSSSPRNLDRPAIEAVLGNHVGRPVRLTDDTTRVSPLAELDQFEIAYEHHQADPAFGIPSQRFFS